MRILMIAVLAAAVAAPAMAAEPGYETFAVKVRTADLDLASQSGQQQLTRRFEAALDKLCGSPVMFNRDERAALDACREEARGSAAAQIGAARALLAVTVATSR